MTTYSAVVTTGIYCRPGCSARPLERNVTLFEHPAAAEAAGFRACYRCRPYRVAGPLSATAPELVCEAVQRIINGALDDGTEQGLAADIGISARHLRRLFRKHLGMSPDQLARSRRAHFARRLLDDTDLTVLEIAFASGFGSLRQFNRIMREVFRAAPVDLRERRRRADRLAADGGLVLRLPVPSGYDWDAVRAFLAARLIPGVEQVDGDAYRRTITVADAPGLLEVSGKDKDCLLLRVHLPYWEGLIHVVDRFGLLLGVHTDFAAGVTALLADRTLGPLIARRPGLVVPGAWSPYELAVRETLTGQQLDEFVRTHGTPVPGLPGTLTHTFPSPPPGYRPDCDTEYLALRQGRRDAFPLTHPSLRAALDDLGLDLAGPPDAWRPWLALAATHLIAHGEMLAADRTAVPGDALANLPACHFMALGHSRGVAVEPNARYRGGPAASVILLVVECPDRFVQVIVTLSPGL